VNTRFHRRRLEPSTAILSNSQIPLLRCTVDGRTGSDAPVISPLPTTVGLPPAAESLGQATPPQHAAFQIAELIEHEQRVVAGALIMTVPNAVPLFAMGWTHA
jgi:hypothetical protein